jgi:hypothetical protein
MFRYRLYDFVWDNAKVTRIGEHILGGREEESEAERQRGGEEERKRREKERKRGRDTERKRGRGR